MALPKAGYEPVKTDPIPTAPGAPPSGRSPDHAATHLQHSRLMVDKRCRKCGKSSRKHECGHAHRYDDNLPRLQAPLAEQAALCRAPTALVLFSQVCEQLGGLLAVKSTDLNGRGILKAALSLSRELGTLAGTRSGRGAEASAGLHVVAASARRGSGSQSGCRQNCFQVFSPVS
jgi:hypothetical protein